MEDNKDKRVITLPRSESGESPQPDAAVPSRRKQRKDHNQGNVATTNRKDSRPKTYRKSLEKLGVGKTIKAMSLITQGKSDSEVIAELKIDNRAIEYIRDQFRHIQKEIDNVVEYRRTRANILDALHQKILEKMSDPDRLDAASAKDLGWVAESIHKQSRLERGESTENKAISFRDVTSTELK